MNSYVENASATAEELQKTVPGGTRMFGKKRASMKISATLVSSG
jgi:hypothetical protein